MASTQPNQDRFAALYATEYSSVHTYLRRRLPASEVDDAVVDTFLVAWRRIDECTGASNPRWWLLATARRVAANSRRGASRRRALVERIGQTTPPVSTPQDDSDDDAVLAIRNVLATLRTDDQEVLRLTYWEDLPVDGIAVVLGVSVAAARKRLQRAERRLTERWPSTAPDLPAVSTSGPVPDIGVVSGATGAVVTPEPDRGES